MYNNEPGQGVHIVYWAVIREREIVGERRQVRREIKIKRRQYEV